MPRYEVLKPVNLGEGVLQPGTIVEADHLHNLDALVNQRYLRSIGDRDRLDAIERRLDALEGKGKPRQ